MPLPPPPTPPLPFPFPPPLPLPTLPSLPTPCLAIPIPDIPTLPIPLTLGLPLVIPGFDLNLCCKIASFLPLPPFPIPIPSIVFEPEVIITLNGLIDALNAYFDQIAFDCPLEGPLIE